MIIAKNVRVKERKDMYWENLYWETVCMGGTTFLGPIMLIFNSDLRFAKISRFRKFHSSTSRRSAVIVFKRIKHKICGRYHYPWADHVHFPHQHYLSQKKSIWKISFTYVNAFGCNRVKSVTQTDRRTDRQTDGQG